MGLVFVRIIQRITVPPRCANFAKNCSVVAHSPAKALRGAESPNRRLQVQKRSQYFIGAHNEMLSVGTMCVTCENRTSQARLEDGELVCGVHEYENHFRLRTPRGPGAARLVAPTNQKRLRR